MNYKFLFKPIFFIFSLVFASWLVLKIEKLRPSDFGKYKSLFESEPKSSTPIQHNKKYLDSLIHSYKIGLIDSVELEERLGEFLKTFPK